MVRLRKEGGGYWLGYGKRGMVRMRKRGVIGLREEGVVRLSGGRMLG